MDKITSYSDMDLTVQCSYTSDDLEVYLRYGLDGLGKLFKQIEKSEGVNAMALIAIAALESNHGRSNIAVNNNNLFGFFSNGKAMSFSSFEECIKYAGKYLKTNYLTTSGKYYKGVTLKDVNYYYCTSKDWYLKIDEIMRSIDYKIEQKRGY